MKKLLPFALVLLFGFPLILPAQPDLIFSPTAFADYQDPLGYFQPHKQLLTINLAGVVRQINAECISGYLSVGYERKIGQQWSVQSELSSMYRFFIDKTSVPSTPANGVVGVTIGPRFYYQQKSRITYGRQVPNLIGNYLGFNIGTRLLPFRPTWNPTEVSHFFTDNFSLIPHTGWQWKIMKHGFIDVRLGMKFSYGDPRRTRHIFPRNAEKFWQIIPVSQLRAGIAF